MYDSYRIQRPMTIGIDFDDTITRDPDLWLTIIQLLRNKGAIVYVVTYRGPTMYPEDLEFLKGRVDAIHFTSFVAKEAYCRERGIYVDIWIDDTPMSITHDLVDGHFRPHPNQGLILKLPTGTMGNTVYNSDGTTHDKGAV